MMKSLNTIRRRLISLVIFRDLLEDPAVQALRRRHATPIPTRPAVRHRKNAAADVPDVCWRCALSACCWLPPWALPL